MTVATAIEYSAEGNLWYRRTVANGRVLLASRHDESDIQREWRSGLNLARTAGDIYDSRCSSCFLGQSHSQDSHIQQCHS